MHREKQDLFSADDRSGELWERMRREERERRMMRSFYSRAAQTIYQRVVEECERLDYPGSFLYDEYPDKRMMELTCRRICSALETSGECGEHAPDDLVRVLLIQEMLRRRDCGRYFP